MGGAKPQPLALIAALDENALIGAEGGLPWHVPEELRYFKRVTTGGVLLMGRTTFESIGRPLPGRRTIVLTRDPHWSRPGVERAGDLPEALRRASGELPVFVAGGAQVYAAALPLAERLFLTRLHASFEGNAWFPTFDESDWRETWCEHHPATDARGFAMTYRVLERA